MRVVVEGTAPRERRTAGITDMLAILVLLLPLVAALSFPLPAAAHQEESAVVPVVDGEAAADPAPPIVEPAPAVSALVPAVAPVVEWAPPRTVYVPETGQILDQLFLDFWRGGGGANAFGYPITPELEENGHIVQYFGYARFEYWPEDPDNPVHLGDVGTKLRPYVVRRSLPSFADATRGFQPEVGAAREAMLAVRAWMPVGPDAAPADADDWRFVPESRHGVWGLFRTFWEATGEEVYLGHPLTEEYVVAGITYQVFERGMMAWEPGSDVWLVPVGELLATRYGLDTSPVAQGDIPTYSEALFVPPASPPVDETGAPPPPPGGGQSIVVSLSQQRMWAYEGDAVVLSSLVSTGKSGFETPPGTFRILVKKEIEDMEGLIGGEYYDVPQVPDVMYFTDVGHAFHGTYWHNDFGTPRSHGCVNLSLDIAAWLYAWTPMGTTVQIVP